MAAETKETKKKVTRPYQEVSEATKAPCGNQGWDPPSQDPRDHMAQPAGITAHM